MGLLSFGKTKSGRIFSTSLVLFTIYTLTNVLRWLPVVEMQLPIIAICYVLLLVSCNRKSANRVLGLSLFLLVFDYVFIFLQGGMSSGSIQNIIGANYTIFVSLMPLLYVVSGNFALIDRQKFMNFIYFLVFFTAVTTILGTYQYETPCRELATPDNVEIDRLYKAQNIGGYGFVYFIVLLAPILIRDILRKRSIAKVALLLLSAFCVLRAEYTTAVLLFVVSFALSFVLNSKNNLLRLIMIIAIIVFALSFETILNWAGSSLSDYSYTMSSRMEMMSDYNDYGEADGDMGERQILYLLSINSFLNSPFFGNLMASVPHPLGGHSEIFDYIGHSGLFGLIVLFLLLSYIRRNTPVSNLNFKDPFVKALMLVVIILASINTFLTPELYYAMLIVPMLIEYDTNRNYAS